MKRLGTRGWAILLTMVGAVVMYIPSAPATTLDADWTQIGSYSPPIKRYGHSMARDVTGRTILFGGITTGTLGIQGDTWRFNGSRWIQLELEISPPERAFAAMAYDPIRQEAVLFGGGGAGSGSLLGDTWVWDGETWTERTPLIAPPTRSYSRMAWDEASGKIILFGGNASAVVTSVLLNDTWSWDGTSWTLETPAVSPGPRYSFGFADGSSTSKPVLFGGTPGAPQGVVFYADTWTWDGVLRTWTLTGATGPSGRSDMAMAYDAALGHTILFGGGSKAVSNPLGAVDMLTDTWTWNGSSWSAVSPATSPWYRGRAWAGLAYDAVAGRTHLFGGYACTAGLSGFVGSCLGGYSNDTWGFTGTTWINVDVTAPNEMQKPMFAHDPINGQVMFGGQYEYGNYSQETWRWDGTEWELLNPAHKPLPRGMAAMVYDPRTDSTLLFSGQIDTLGLPGPRLIGDTIMADTWKWDGVDWIQLTPATSPPARSEAMIAFDAANNEVVMFGGSGSGFAKNDTWVWDGSNWIEKHPATSPPERLAGSMAYDPVRQEVVLFGGMMSKNTGYHNDTWVWDGNNWTEILTPPGGSPPMRAFGGMGWDPSTETIIYFGGCSNCYANPTYDETWSWNGSSWTKLSPVHAPERMTSFSMLSGDAANPLMIFGGRRAVLTPSGGGASYPEGTNHINSVWKFGLVEAQ